MNDKNIDLSDRNSDYVNKIKKLTEENTNLANKNKNLSEYNKLFNIKKGKDQKDEMLFSLMKKLEDRDNEINKLKSAIPFELKEGEEFLLLYLFQLIKKFIILLFAKAPRFFLW